MNKVERKKMLNKHNLEENEKFFYVILRRYSKFIWKDSEIVDEVSELCPEIGTYSFFKKIAGCFESELMFKTLEDAKNYISKIKELN